MTPEPLIAGFCFGEGPRWFQERLWFSDMLGEAVHTVTLDGVLTTLALAGHAPSGLGFRPDGALLVVSTETRQVLRHDGTTLSVVADLAAMVPANLGDMVVDHVGRIYVGSQAREGGVIVRIDTDDRATVVADGLDFPNGMVITPDGTTLIVAESTGRRLTAFTIDDQVGGLVDRAVFAADLDGPPDGIALDADGGIWASLTLSHQFQRITAGGNVTHRVEVAGRAAIACTLGGPDRRTLFLLSSTEAYPERLVGTKLSRVDTQTVAVAGAGLP